MSRLPLPWFGPALCISILWRRLVLPPRALACGPGHRPGATTKLTTYLALLRHGLCCKVAILVPTAHQPGVLCLVTQHGLEPILPRGRAIYTSERCLVPLICYAGRRLSSIGPIVRDSYFTLTCTGTPRLGRSACVWLGTTRSPRGVLSFAVLARTLVTGARSNGGFTEFRFGTAVAYRLTFNLLLYIFAH